MKPSKGRIVWYGIEGSYSAAIIVDVDDEAGYVALCVFGVSGFDFVDAEFSTELADGKWTWPVKDA